MYLPINTGRKIYRYLKQINTVTGLPTGLIKQNLIGDPDYIPPVIDPIKCPTTIWRPINPVCEVMSVCPTGYFLNALGTACEKDETVIADYLLYPLTGCPIGWEYFIPIGGRPVCRRITTTPFTSIQTGMKKYTQREEVTNGIVVFTEDNIDAIGIGPYFGPVQDLTSCPKPI